MPRSLCSCGWEDMSNLPYSCTLRVAFPTEKQARVCKECMEVDEELTDKSAKVLRTEGSTLVVDFYAADLKMLRIATSSFFDMVQVSVKTLLEFDKESA